MPLEKDFDRIDEINWSPEFPKTSSFIKGIPTEHSTAANSAEHSGANSGANFMDNSNGQSKGSIKEHSKEDSEECSVGIYDSHRPLENNDDIAMKLLCSYLK